MINWEPNMTPGAINTFTLEAIFGECHKLRFMYANVNNMHIGYMHASVRFVLTSFLDP